MRHAYTLSHHCTCLFGVCRWLRLLALNLEKDGELQGMGMGRCKEDTKEHGENGELGNSGPKSHDIRRWEVDPAESA